MSHASVHHWQNSFTLLSIGLEISDQSAITLFTLIILNKHRSQMNNFHHYKLKSLAQYEYKFVQTFLFTRYANRNMRNVLLTEKAIGKQDNFTISYVFVSFTYDSTRPHYSAKFSCS